MCLVQGNKYCSEHKKPVEVVAKKRVFFTDLISYEYYMLPWC